MQAFCPRIDMLNGNRCILRIQGAPVRRKLGMILESGSKIEVRKKCFFIKWSPKLIFLNDFFFENILLIFDIEN